MFGKPHARRARLLLLSLLALATVLGGGIIAPAAQAAPSQSTASANVPSGETVFISGYFDHGCMSATNFTLGATVREVECSYTSALVSTAGQNWGPGLTQLKPLENQNLAVGVVRGRIVLVKASDWRHSALAVLRLTVNGHSVYVLAFAHVGPKAWVIWNGISGSGQGKPLTLSYWPTLQSATLVVGCNSNNSCSPV